MPYKPPTHCMRVDPRLYNQVCSCLWCGTRREQKKTRECYIGVQSSAMLNFMYHMMCSSLSAQDRRPAARRSLSSVPACVYTYSVWKEHSERILAFVVLVLLCSPHKTTPVLLLIRGRVRGECGPKVHAGSSGEQRFVQAVKAYNLGRFWRIGVLENVLVIMSIAVFSSEERRENSPPPYNLPAI